MATDIMGMFERLRNRIMVMIGRGFISAANDTGNLQILQLALGQNETMDNVPRLAEYGYTSLPPIDGKATAVVLFINGDRANGVAIATGHVPSRKKGLKAGESALYDDLGQTVYLTRTGIIIDGAGMPITLQNAGSGVHVAGVLNVDGDVVSGGKVSASGDVISSGGNLTDSTGKSLNDARLVFDVHVHPDAQGGNTGPTPTSM